VAAFVQAAPKPAAPAAAKPAAAAPATFKTKEEIPAATKARLEGLVKSAKCVAFIKGTPTEPRCGFTKQLLQLFAQHQIDFQSVNILADEEARQGAPSRRPKGSGRTAPLAGLTAAVACSLFC